MTNKVFGEQFIHKCNYEDLMKDKQENPEKYEHKLSSDIPWWEELENRAIEQLRKKKDEHTIKR